MSARPLNPSDRLRAICLALPLASEKAMKRGPTYRIEERIFAMDRPVDGRPSVWCKAPPGSQAVLIGADSDRFFAPPYVGPKGWIGVRLDAQADWSEVEALLRRSYRLVAPRRLAAVLK
jgi:predicted DNA-binding protein (MmcQ/YjbR family)